MELRQLKYFCKTAEKLNFTESAKALFITQSTLSQQIKQLEIELGVELFERVGKKVFLTEAGSVFLPFAQKTIDDSEFGIQRLQDLQDIRTGELNIGVINSVIDNLPPAITEFAKLYPGVKINIGYHQTHNLHVMLAERKYDLIVCYQTDKDEENENVQTLYQNVLSVIVAKGHPLSARKSVPVSMLADYHLVLPTSSFYARSILDSLADKHNVKLTPEVEMNGGQLLQKLVNTGHWITVLPDVPSGIDSSLISVPLQDKVIMKTAVISLKDAYLKKSAHVFADILVKYMRKDNNS